SPSLPLPPLPTPLGYPLLISCQWLAEKHWITDKKQTTNNKKQTTNNNHHITRYDKRLPERL
ncbi:MAG TPA: hypothetical protein DCY91_17250, partial [Cyanobacteria bacterium UBA11370]|nr:hypothetical protein [Cyanobacteria bacterium UBA11370]